MDDLYWMVPFVGNALLPDWHVAISFLLHRPEFIERCLTEDFTEHSTQSLCKTCFIFITTCSLFLYFVLCLQSVSLSLSWRSTEVVTLWVSHYYFPVSRTCHDNGRFLINADGMREWVNEWVIHCRYILPMLNYWFARESYLVWIVCHSNSYKSELPDWRPEAGAWGQTWRHWARTVLMMKLEPIIQSEVSQKDKDHYNILTHIYGI